MFIYIYICFYIYICLYTLCMFIDAGIYGIMKPIYGIYLIHIVGTIKSNDNFQQTIEIQGRKARWSFSLAASAKKRQEKPE